MSAAPLVVCTITTYRAAATVFHFNRGGPDDELAMWFTITTVIEVRVLTHQIVEGVDRPQSGCPYV